MDDFKKLINASDLTDWIMEAYPDWCVGAVRSIVDHVEEMPSAQPEIIRCKDCNHWTTMVERPKHGTCDQWCTLNVTRRDEYCSRAERKEK